MCLPVAKEQQRIQLKAINEELTSLRNRHNKARDLRLADDIEPDDYRYIKSECERKSSILESKIAEISGQAYDIQPQIETAIDVLEHLDQHYITATTDVKRQIVDSIFPDKLIFDGSSYRTARVNEAVRVIFNLGAAFEENKKGQTSDFSDLSHGVIQLGLEPRAPTLKVLCSTN